MSFVPSDPALNARIVALHARLPFDPNAQIKIDAHLLAAALPNPALIMLPEDAPQLATLPDLCPVIRSCLIGRKWRASYLASLLHGCIPCPRPPQHPVPPDTASAPFLLNIVLATLLGLYPQSVKQPPFPVRVVLFRRIHQALTLDGPSQIDLLARIHPLVMLSLTEYICHVLPAYMPVEYAAIRDACAVDPFFATAVGLFDLFRQDHIDSGAEPWDALVAPASELHDRLTRIYRSKCRLPPSQRRTPAGETPPAHLAAALAAHSLVRYPCHSACDALLPAEYALLLNSASLAETALLHSLVAVHPLPANITRMQEDALELLEQHCQRRARVRRTHYLCLLCEHRGRKASPRLCSRTFRIVCQTCDDNPDSIVPIDAIGRILTIRGRQLFFAPCCATIRDYAATGQDISLWPCQHKTDPPPPPRAGRPRVPCAICDAQALPKGHEYLDHLACRMVTCFLCQRHTPPEDWLRHVPNRRCFDAVCLEWDQKIRAIHRRG